MGGSRRRIVVTLLLALALATGCSSGSRPAPVTSTVTVPPASASSSASASASLAPPVLPAAARQPTRAGAQAFFRYFWDVYNYSFDARDPALLRSISDPGCAFCSSSIKNVEEARRDNLTFRGGVVTVDVSVAAPDDPMVGMLVNGIVDQSYAAIFNSQGDQISSTHAETDKRVDAGFVYVATQWVVLVIDKNPASS